MNEEKNHGSKPEIPRMNIDLRAVEVVEVAVLLEKTAVDFYRLLSDSFDDGPLRNFFLGLTGMELEHERKMRDLLATLSDPPPTKLAFDEGLTGREYFLNLRSLALKKLFPEGFELFDMIDNFKAPQDALPTALELEGKSLRLYQTLARFQLSTEAQMVVERLLQDERHHLADIEKIFRRHQPA